MGGLLAGCVWTVAIGGKPPPTLAQRRLYIMCLTQDPCGRGLAPMAVAQLRINWLFHRYHCALG
ncbi:hypothetical protein BB029_17720 [Pseudomonas sp. S3E12]|nr:hypothetical protein BB029_17720 [Pseudomonas sp. S3E12]